MKHTILTVLLTLGVVGGIAGGVMGCHHRGHMRHHEFESHIADVCAKAALRAKTDH